MADSGWSVDEVRLDIRDPDVTHVFAYIRAIGDSPFPSGWRHKTFPAQVPSSEILSSKAFQECFIWPIVQMPGRKLCEVDYCPLEASERLEALNRSVCSGHARLSEAIYTFACTTGWKERL